MKPKVFDLTPEEIAELDERIAAVERGEFIDGDEVIRRLRSGYCAAESFELTSEQEDDLERSIAEIERGEFVTAGELLEELRAMREHPPSDCHRST